MNARDEEALALWQAKKADPAIETLLDEFFGVISVQRYEEQLRCVSEVMSAPVIFTSDLPPHLSGAL